MSLKAGLYSLESPIKTYDQQQQFASSMGFGGDFQVGSPVYHISMWYSDHSTNWYDLYKIETGVVVQKQVSHHGFTIYDVQTYNGNNPSSKYVAVDGWRLAAQ